MTSSNSRTMSSSLEAHNFAAETQNSGLIQFEPGSSEDITLSLQEQEYIENINELQVYLDKVNKIVRPGCSQEVLKVAVSSMSSLVRILSVMSSKSKPHASL